MAHVKAGGTSKNLKDSRSQRLGVKIFGGQIIKTGQIIIRQRGQKYHAGLGVEMGNDHTIFAMKDGTVKFQKKKLSTYTGSLQHKTIVHVV